jgi:hypothetical protein
LRGGPPGREHGGLEQHQRRIRCGKARRAAYVVRFLGRQ